jgi:pyruvate/2-oxoglutarate dehydrogenase complex dihydrolipoamide acyltransferase (E2) component
MDVLMPQLGETVAEGKISAWFKSVGEQVKAGDNLFEVETDKTAMDVPTLVSGVVAEIRVSAGETAPVGTVVAVIEDRVGGTVAPAAIRTPAAPKQEAAWKSAPNASGAAAQVTPAHTPELRRANAPYDPFREIRSPERNYGSARLPDGTAITPLARRLAAEAGIDLSGVQGSGPRGRVVAQDVAARAGAGKATTAKPSISHFHLRRDISLDPVLGLIEKVNAHDPGLQITLRDCVVKALAVALTQVPELGLQQADIVIETVGADAQVIRAANGKGLGAIAQTAAAVSDAREPDGVAAVCDMSARGAGANTAIVRPPQIAALTVGAIEQGAAVRDGRIAAENRCTLTLCCDRRAVDDVVGAKLMSACATILERPIMLIV